MVDDTVNMMPFWQRYFRKRDSELMLSRTEMRDEILSDIVLERLRQMRLKDQGRFKNTPDEVPLLRSYAMLSEEMGEVARAILSTHGFVQEDLSIEDVRKELIQVAAIAVAMVEGIDKFTESDNGAD